MQTTSSKVHFSPQGCFNLERASTCTQTRTHTHTHQSTRYWRHYFFTFALRSTPNCANKVHQPRNNCGRVPRLLLLMSTTTFSTGNSFSSTTSNSHIIIININIRSCTHLHKALMGKGDARPVQPTPRAEPTPVSGYCSRLIQSHITCTSRISFYFAMEWLRFCKSPGGKRGLAEWCWESDYHKIHEGLHHKFIAIYK